MRKHRNPRPRLPKRPSPGSSVSQAPADRCSTRAGRRGCHDVATLNDSTTLLIIVQTAAIFVQMNVRERISVQSHEKEMT